MQKLSIQYQQHEDERKGKWNRGEHGNLQSTTKKIRIQKVVVKNPIEEIECNTK